jgi:Ca-activated chloride channel family protein
MVTSAGLHTDAQTAGTPAEKLPGACTEDAMIVFDASGSMAGTEYLGIATFVTRIDKVRKALANVLPSVARYRKIGLITYGPGPYNKCDNIKLEAEPRLSAASRILAVVNALVPAGRTPLTAAVSKAADVLHFKEKPGTIVLVTDGEETCGGSPCSLADRLRSEGRKTTVHVISYRVKDYSWTGAQGALATKCLPERTGGLYIPAQTTDELTAALRKTLGCPLITQR